MKHSWMDEHPSSWFHSPSRRLICLWIQYRQSVCENRPCTDIKVPNVPLLTVPQFPHQLLTMSPHNSQIKTDLTKPASSFGHYNTDWTLTICSSCPVFKRKKKEKDNGSIMKHKTKHLIWPVDFVNGERIFWPRHLKALIWSFWPLFLMLVTTWVQLLFPYRFFYDTTPPNHPQHI